MAQYELNFRDYWRIIRRRRLVIGITGMLVAAVVVYANNAQIPVYRASAQVRIGQPRTMAQMLTGAIVTTYYENPLVTEAETIQGRPVAEAVARRLGLVDAQADPEAFQQLVSSVQASITAEPVRSTSLITITVMGSDPDRVYRITTLVTEAYVDINRQQKRHNASEVRDFIERQLADTDQRLRSAEEEQKRLREQGASGLAVALEHQLHEIQTQRADLLSRATPLHPDIARMDEQLRDVQDQLRGLPQDELAFARVEREVKVTEEMYTTLRRKLEEARIAEAEKIEDVTVVNTATRPRHPIRPNKRLGYLVGPCLGLLVGLVMAFITENMDTSLGTIEDVESLLQVPVLGVIPHVRIEQIAKGESRFIAERLEHKARRFWRTQIRREPEAQQPISVGLFTHFYPKAPEAEAFRTLRTNLKISPQRKVILITSSSPQEGKTNIVSNLGIVFAQAGLRVLLIASDLRKPELPKVFGLRRDVGLTEVLNGSIPLEQAIRGFADLVMGKLSFNEVMRTPGLDNLSILPSGHIPANPSELLGSPQMPEFLARLRHEYDLVILDAPPILPVTDSMLLAPLVDTVVLVYEVGRTARAGLLRAKTQLESTGVKVLGVILNHVRPETTQYPAYYYYRYRYEESDTAGEDARGRPAQPA